MIITGREFSMFDSKIVSPGIGNSEHDFGRGNLLITADQIHQCMDPILSRVLRLL